MINRITVNFSGKIAVPAVCTVITVCFLMCSSGKIEEQHFYGDECKHCHGEMLEGSQNVKFKCGECHDPLRMKPGEMKAEEKIDAVFNGSHPHNTDNMFKSTPSCFYCHRRTDF